MIACPCMMGVTLKTSFSPTRSRTSPLRPCLPAPLRSLVLTLSLLALGLMHGCSGGDATSDGSTPIDTNPMSPGTVLSAGPGCDLQYTLTDNAVLTGADPLLAEQWHLRNFGQTGGVAGEDIRVTEAWSITRGSGVRVAVIDDSVEIVHPDLKPNVIENGNRSYRVGNRNKAWPLPCKEAEDDHGTSVAGLIAARDNNGIGVAGVASRASLVAFDALSTSTNLDIADALNRDYSLNAIYNNSWGSPDTGGPHKPDSYFSNAIENGLSNGRGGLGSIFVFPGGNGACFREDQNGACVDDNSNLDGYVNQRGTIAVCAVDDGGKSPWYAEAGANLLVCAPTSTSDSSRPVDITTTAIKSGYRSDFSGTSASAPQVSGLAALMLSVNPNLSWRDVRLILAQTARKNDPTHPDWLPASTGNGFHHRYGYGVIDAGAAVRAAQSWRSVGGSGSLKTCESGLRSPNRPIPDASQSGAGIEISDSIQVSAASCDIASVEFVEVTVTTVHGYTGDLQIKLTSPQGRVSELVNSRSCMPVQGRSDACGAYTGWTFGSARHMGESGSGNWTLSVADRAPVDTGRLVSWSIRIHGR